MEDYENEDFEVITPSDQLSEVPFIEDSGYEKARFKPNLKATVFD